MKYIFYPFYVIFVIVSLSMFFTIKYVLVCLWEFKNCSYSKGFHEFFELEDGRYFFDLSIKEMFILNWHGK